MARTRHNVGPLPIVESVRQDEALLAAGRPAVRVAVLLDRSISLGITQPPNDPVAVRARAEGLPVVSRSTGGSGLLHMPGDLAWSVVLPRDHPAAGHDFISGYDRLGAGVVAFLAESGIRAEWADPFRLSESYCLLGSRGRVLTAGGRAIGGAAQHATRDALLHHGVLNRAVDRDLLERVFEVPPETARERVSGYLELGVGRSPIDLAERLLYRLTVSVNVDLAGSGRSRATGLPRATA
jgi:lipoate-protein ligase A